MPMEGKINVSMKMVTSMEILSFLCKCRASDNKSTARAAYFQHSWSSFPSRVVLVSDFIITKSLSAFGVMITIRDTFVVGVARLEELVQITVSLPMLPV